MGNIMIWQRLAWLEWYRSLWHGRPNRDFFWLTLLLTLTLLLAMLLWGSQRGLLNQFIDVSIGYVEGTGVPIWVAADTVQGINREMLNAVDFKLYPYREVATFEVALIGENQAEEEDNNPIWQSNEIAFTGWAVSFDDPLWQLGTQALNSATSKNHVNQLPLTVILNKSLFSKYFNCEHYVEQLQAQLPFWAFLNKEHNHDPLFCLTNQQGKQELWLDVKLQANRQLIPFEIIWQHTIPTLQDLAFLLPLSTLNTLTLSRYYLDLEYFPQVQAYNIAQVKQVMWQGFDEQPIMQKLMNCFPTATIKGSRLTFKYPITENLLIQCTQYHQISLQMDNERLLEDYLQITEKKLPTYQFQYESNSHWLTVSCIDEAYRCSPCEKAYDLAEVLNDLSGKIVVCEEANNHLKIDMIAAIGGYSYAFAYVEKRAELVNKVAEITQFRLLPDKNNIFYIHSSYEDALVRFMFIDKVMKILELFYSPFFLGFLIVLLAVQISIVVTHRRHNYGIYLSKGISSLEIRLIVLMQMTLSLGVAIGITIGIVELMQWQLIQKIYSVTTTQPYVDHIVAGQLDLLPISWQDYLVVWIFFMILLYLITEILLNRLISFGKKQPAYLIG